MMGLNWYLEMISSLIFDISQDGMIVIFLDIVNMLQGVWVFGNFVCQRNITEALLKALILIRGEEINISRHFSPEHN